MIRKTILLVALAVAFTSCKESAAEKLEETNLEQVATNTGMPKISIDNREHDFGELNLKDKAEHTFIIKNEGTADLLILEAKPSCGCTVPDNYTKTPIKPGETGVVPVVFNATSAGVQTKTVTLTTNTETGTEVLTIKA
ncbi:MAG: DUF1573 domain-containing protein, partial [Flavobacteriaceae bacterium]